VPVWHASAKPYVDSGKVGVLGIVQEQHPDRAKLFMQWQQMDWQLLSDPLNLLGISAVPITLLVDEHGVIRKRGAKPRDLQVFLKASYPEPARRSEIEMGWITDLDRKFLRRKKPSELDQIIAGYQTLKKGKAERADLTFRLGVVYRTRFDSMAARPNDFVNAVHYWQAALDTRPGQYIWRRRIQQFGPRLAKPYPFYDWVPEARMEILDRGETPVPLSVEPRGSEIARPSRAFVTEAQAELRHPDPDRKLRRDNPAIQTEIVVVPPVPKAGETVRVHLVLKPSGAQTVWNNEADPLVVFAGDLPESWQSNRRHFRAPMPQQAESSEARSAEFEIRIPRSAKPGRHLLEFESFFYACDKDTGTCTFLAKDLTAEVRVH
jgi:hypothetical protein